MRAFLLLLLLQASQALPAHGVAGGAQPVVSPRGDLLAFLSDRDGMEDVYVVSTRGHGEKRLTHTPEKETGLQWSADGKRILFSVTVGDGSRLFEVDPGGAAPHELGRFPGRTPMLSPDGKRVVFMAGTWTATRLTVSGLDGGEAREITDGSSIAWNVHWSPEGQRLAFTGRNDPSAELAVFVMGADGTERRQVTRVPPQEGGAQWPVWSPDGRLLAVQVNSRTTKGSAHLWIVDVASGAAKKLAPHAAAYLDETPAWFPDGKRLAFQSDRTGRLEVWTMRADGTGERQLTGR